MKTITKNKCVFKKIAGIAILFLGLNGIISAQCNASFTYTTTASSIQVTSTSTGVDSATLFEWNFMSHSSFYSAASGSSPSYNSIYNGTYTLSLTMSDSIGCSSSVTQTITISGGQNAPACSSSFTYTLASGGLVNFTNTSPSDPYSNTAYSCNFGDGYLYGYLVPHTYYYNGNYVVSLNVSNNMDNCSTSSSQTITITNAHPAATCTAAFTYTLGAAGQVNFTSLYTGTDYAIRYNWIYGDGNGNYNGSSSQSYTYLYNGTYNVNLNVEDSLNNCSNITTQTISITNAATQPCTPTVTFVIHQDSLNPQPGVWQVSSYYSPQVSNAIWYWGDGSSTVGFAPTHSYASAGQYNICVTVYAACGDSSTNCQYDSLYRMAQNSQNSVISVTVLDVNGTGSTSGIKTNAKETGQISIYPNPSTGFFTLQINNVSPFIAKAQINISNMLGEIIYSRQEQAINNFISKEIDLQNISNGAYFMKINIDNKTYTNKIIISK